MSHSSVVGGSTATRVLACPGSIDLCRKLPPERSSIYADIGTACHEVMEARLLELPDPVSPLLTTAIFADKIEPAWGWFQATFHDAEFWVEKSVNFGAEIIDPQTGEKAFGTADVIFCADDGRAGIVDWKFGDGHLVDAENNDQMRFYLAAAIRSGYLPKQSGYEAWIFQPSLKLAPANYASRGTYKWDDLQAFTRLLRSSVVTLPRPFATGSQCHWCRAKTICDAYLDNQFGSDTRQLLNSRKVSVK